MFQGDSEKSNRQKNQKTKNHLTTNTSVEKTEL